MVFMLINSGIICVVRVRCVRADDSGVPQNNEAFAFMVVVAVIGAFGAFVEHLSRRVFCRVVFVLGVARARAEPCRVPGGLG